MSLCLTILLQNASDGIGTAQCIIHMLLLAVPFVWLCIRLAVSSSGCVFVWL